MRRKPRNSRRLGLEIWKDAMETRLDTIIISGNRRVRSTSTRRIIINQQEKTPIRVDIDRGQDPYKHKGILLCPRCGKDSYLHHQGVSYFARQEDGAFGTRVDVREKDVDEIPFHQVCVSTDTHNRLVENPSRRRGGIAISFWCELCGGSYEFCIAQHKGQTLVFWRDTVSPPTTT